jgi:23S rRNA pseudouridine2605 synthase
LKGHRRPVEGKDRGRALATGGAGAAGAAGAERLQKVLAQLGLGSRREVEDWIRAGRLSVNGRTAVLGTRVLSGDQVRLDGRQIRQRAIATAGAAEGVLLCHRSPGQPLLPPRSDPRLSASAPTRVEGEPELPPVSALAARPESFAERLPRRLGRRFVSISPLAVVDGGLELLSADGTLAARLQRAVGALPMEFSLRVRGELDAAQQRSILEGALDSGAMLDVQTLEAAGGEGSNRWYRLITRGASGAQVRQLIERQAVTLIRALRTRLGPLELPRTLARGRWRELTEEELNALLGNPASDR